MTILLFSALLIPYVILCFYTHPVADDYNLAHLASFWDMQWKLYLGWNGRYSSNFMAMVNPILYDSLIGYRLFALLLLLLLPLSIYYGLSASVGKAFSALQKIAAAIIIAVLILGLLPSLPEGIYWYSGSVTYIVGCIAASFYIGTAIMYGKGIFFINKFLHLCLCGILLFIAIGFNEVQMFLLLFAHIVVWVSVNKKERFHLFWFLMLFFCMLFSAIVFFSPGNHFREAYFPDSHRPMNSLFMTFAQMLRFFLKWVSYFPLLLASIIFIPLSRKLYRRSSLFQRLGNYNPWLMFSLLWIILFICVFPPYWSTGILGQHRTLNTACFFFIPTWFLFLHSLFTRMKLSEKMVSTLNQPIQLSVTLLLAVSLLFTGNGGTALMDLAAGKASGFDYEMNNRIAIIMAAKKFGLKDVSLPALQNKPQSLFVLDVQPGCNDMPNQMLAHFFGLTKICVDSTQNTNNR